MTAKSLYYISSGEKNAMRTLRRVNISGARYADTYIANLARDFDVAVAKAKAIIGDAAELRATEFDLNDWGVGFVPKSWQREQIAILRAGLMPFGKHKGTELVALDEGYVKWWLTKAETNNVVGSMLISELTKISEANGWDAKWFAEDMAAAKEKEEKIAKMAHVGTKGKREALTLLCEKVLSLGVQQHAYNVSSEMFMNICRDREGNKIVYTGVNAWEAGKYYEVKAMIKDHVYYNGEPQTRISRPTILRTHEVE